MSRMFNNLMRELRTLEKSHSIPVQIEIDDKGYLDRSCPSENCRTHFKLLFDDWESLIRDEVVFCPLCRFEADSSQWNTSEQSAYHRALATAHVQKSLSNALRQDVRRFNSRQRNNDFINISMSYRPGQSPVAVPVSAAAVMTQEFRCVECHCRYSSIGIAYFCPACGFNNVYESFFKTIETARRTMQSISVIQRALLDSLDENVAQDSVRQITESSLCKIVASFQKYAESCFTRLANSGDFKLRRNVFQNLEESNNLWQNATSTGYTDILTTDEYQKLTLYFQQRHLLEHQDGIVDQEYMDRSKDGRFAKGQKLVVPESSVSELASIIEKLSLGIYTLK